MSRFRSHSNIFILFYNAPASSGIYTLSLHDALPICSSRARGVSIYLDGQPLALKNVRDGLSAHVQTDRSEEHTSELQSPCNLVCRLLLEKKKKTNNRMHAVVNTKQKK